MSEGHEGQGGHPGVQMGPDQRCVSRCPDEAKGGSHYPYESVENWLPETPLKI